jgi:uncharacterized protein
VTVAQLAVVAFAVLIAATTQAITGFGFGLLSMPVMTLAIDPKTAVVVSSLIGTTVTTWQAVRLHGDGDAVVRRRLIVAAYLGMPIGLVVYEMVANETLQLLLGVVVLLAVLSLIAPVALPVGRVMDGTAGFLSGVLNTSLSTNGPPLVFALQARRMPATMFRGTIIPTFAVCNVGALTMFIVRGKVNADGLTAAAVAVPAMLAGQLLGQPMRTRVDERSFRRLVLGLLTVAAISAIGASL